MMTTNPYSSASTRGIDRKGREAAKFQEAYMSWANRLSTAQDRLAADKAEFVATFENAAALKLAASTSEVRELEGILGAIEDCGGWEAARSRFLSTDSMYALIAHTFSERADTLREMIPNALKKLGEQRATLTERGANVGTIELDPSVCAWREFIAAATTNLATTVSGLTYAHAHGLNYAPRTFDSLYADLTQPLPVPPAPLTPTRKP